MIRQFAWVAVAGLAACNRLPSVPTPLPIPIPVPLNPFACGVERWSVKTLADPDATRVDIVNAMPTTISALNVATARCTGLPEPRTFAEEFRVYEVTGTVMLTRNEDDRDVHIALVDDNDASKTIVVEVADPGCATSSPHITLLTNTKLQYDSLGALTGRRVTVRGVGFYDFAHGQIGRSQSCLELHPVVSIGLASSTAPPIPTAGAMVISEFRTRGPNGGNDEFIKLHNVSASPISLFGWNVLGSNAGGVTSVRRSLSGTIAAGCFFLLANDGTNGYSGTVRADVTYGIGITDDGGIALQDDSGRIVDQVGMSNGSAYKEGGPLEPMTTNTDRSYGRTGADTNDNARDFAAKSPSNPQNSTTCAASPSVWTPR